MKLKRWDYDSIHKEALKYKHRGEFQKNSTAYKAARRRSILDEVCSHMELVRMKWTKEMVVEEALKYDKVKNFYKKSNRAYKAAYSLNILDEVCSHMYFVKRYNRYWTKEKIQKEALKYKSRSEFQKNSTAYQSAVKQNIINDVCSHMNFLCKRMWTKKEMQETALKYNTRTEFFKKNSGAYCAATRHDILDEVCSHMKAIANTSGPERQLFDIIKEKYPKAQKLRDRNIKIKNKPYIKGFDIDIYISELRKGVEFDGDYWHSMSGLKRSRKHWPQEDLENYHQIKDKYFKGRDIDILHVKEKDFMSNPKKEVCKVYNFLDNKEL